MWIKVINRGFFSNVLFLILYLSSLVALGQQNEDLLNYANEIKIFDSKKAIVICENMLRRTHSKNCDAYEILIEANFILEDYDQALEYIYKLKDERCSSTFDQTLKLDLIEAEIYHILNLEAYEAEVFKELKNMLNESHNEHNKIKDRIDLYNKSVRLVDKESFSNFNNEEYDSFSYLYSLKAYGLLASKQAHLIDFKSKFLSNYPSLGEDYESIYHQNFSLIEAQYYFTLKDYGRSIDILQRTLTFLKPIQSHYYYKNKIIDLLIHNFIEIKDVKSLLELREIGDEIDQKIQEIEISAINKIIKNIKGRNDNEYNKLKRKNTKDIFALVLVSSILILTGTLMWFRYYWQERQYSEIEQYLTQLNNKSSEKDVKTKAITKISDDVENKIITGLKEFETNEEFLNNNVSLAYLASKLEVNTRYLSSFLNSQTNESFSSYINRLRIEYVVNKLKNESKYLKYKISYLAEESGYTSHSSFTTAFKAVTGMSPTKFINYLKK